jgi:hypothetical protein
MFAANRDAYSDSLKQKCDRLNAEVLYQNYLTSSTNNQAPDFSSLVQAIHLESDKAAKELVSLFFMEQKSKDVSFVLTALTKFSSNNALANFCLGQLYAGKMIGDTDIFPVLPHDTTARSALARTFLNKAIQLGCEPARFFLLKSLLQKSESCLQPDYQAWLTLTLEFAENGHQACALDIAKLLIDEDKLTAKKYLLTALSGTNFTITYQALSMLTKDYLALTKVEQLNLFNDIKEMMQVSNRLIAIYIALSHLPEDFIPTADARCAPPLSFRKLVNSQDKGDLKEALAVAVGSSDEVVSKLAQAIYAAQECSIQPSI